ncbi:RNA 2'-phosphotransferase [bacterium]|nr:RNA 2'-phosphotransferase [bacterium]
MFDGESPLFIIKPSSKKQVESVPLIWKLTQNGQFYVDNSGSTYGQILNMEENCTNTFASKWCALWNSRCGQLQELHNVRWNDAGCTNPSTIGIMHKEKLKECTVFGLITDGCVSSPEIKILAQQCQNGTIPTNIPMILGVASTMDTFQTVNNIQVSVLLAPFESAQCAILIAILPNCIKLLAVKGPWESHFPNMPNLSDNPTIDKFPSIDIETQIHTLPVFNFESTPVGCIPVSLPNMDENESFMNLNKLLQVKKESDIIEVTNTLSMNDAENTARYFNRNGQSKVIRTWVTNMESMMESYQRTIINEGTSENNETFGINSLIEQLNNQTSEQERFAITEQIRKSFASVKVQEKDDTVELRSRFKKARQFLSTIHSVLTELEKSTLGADVLGRKSNRAKRADTTQINDKKSLTELKFADDIFKTECLISGDDNCIIGILISVVPPEMVENNTADWILDMPMAQFSKQWNLDLFNNCPINIEDGTAETILTRFGTDPTSRRPVKTILPIISLGSEENRNQVYFRLCDAFFGGLKMSKSTVWQLTLSIIMWTMKTKEWAGPETEIGKAFKYFGGQILDNIYICENIRDGTNIPMKDAFAKSIYTDVLTKHYPAEGTAMILMIMNEWNIIPFNGCSLRNIATISLHMQIVKSYQINVKKNRVNAKNNLIKKLFEVYSGDINIAEIAGSILELDRFENLMPNYIISIFDTLATSIKLENISDFIVPSVRLIIWACINCVTPNDSSSSAIESCIDYQSLASEFNSKLVGLVESDDVNAILRGWLSWAEIPRSPLPPFATPFGASLIWFCPIMTNQPTINMMQGWEGFDIVSNENSESLSYFINQIFTENMDREFKSYNGSFIFEKTITYNLHKAMWITWNIAGIHPEDPYYIAHVIKYLVNTKRGNVHTKHIAKDIVSLIPSLIAVGPIEIHKHFENASINCIADIDRISFKERLLIEINNRPISEIKNESSPNIVYFDDIVVDEMLQKYKLSIPDDVDDTEIPDCSEDSPVKKMQSFTDDKMARKLIAGLRHNRWSSNGSITTEFQPTGFVNVDDIINIMKQTGIFIDVDQMQRCVHNCNKQRLSFHIDENGTQWIRANQGHSVSAVTIEASHNILTTDRFNYCYHGTSVVASETIMKTGLHRMGRNAIQMSVGKIGDPQVISGIRPKSEVVLQIDMKTAIRDGIKFYISNANDVIVSEGPIPAKFITILIGDDRFYS